MGGSRHPAQTKTPGGYRRGSLFGLHIPFYRIAPGARLHAGPQSGYCLRYQWIKMLAMQMMMEPTTGTAMEPMVQVFRLVLMSMPLKLVTTWK